MPSREAKRKRPIRTARIELNGEYTGTWADARVNPPFRVFDLFGENTRKALGEVLIGWNLVDEQGAPVELEPTLSGATDEELSAFARGYLEALANRTALPKEPETPSGITSPTST